MLMPPNRHRRAIIPDSLLPNIRKKQLTQDMTLDPAAGGSKNHVKLNRLCGQKPIKINMMWFSYPAFLNAQFCPLIEPTRCCQATLPTCRGSWRSISCRHCWSHRWSRACSPPCCGGTCCWPVYSRQTCIWTNLTNEKEKEELLLCNTESKTLIETGFSVSVPTS